MAFPNLGQHRDSGISAGRVLRAMASAAMPKDMEWRQLGMASTLQNMVSMGTSGDTGHPGNARLGNDTPTLQMVWDAQQSIFSGQPTFSLRGGGGWQSWQKRGSAPFRTTKKEVNKPNLNLVDKGKEKGRSLGYGKSWGSPRKGSVRPKHSSGVKDARVSQPKGSGKKRLKLSEISNNLDSASWKRKAIQKLRGKMFAKSTLASKASKRRKLSEVLSKVKGDETEFFPLSADDLEVVGAVLSELGLKAGEQYINEVKLMQLEAGYHWDEVLERQLAMIKRALRRDVGPDKRAAEVRPDQVTVEDMEEGPQAAEGKPAFPKISYVFAAVWMLKVVRCLLSR